MVFGGGNLGGGGGGGGGIGGTGYMRGDYWGIGAGMQKYGRMVIRLPFIIIPARAHYRHSAPSID